MTTWPNMKNKSVMYIKESINALIMAKTIKK